MVQKLNVERVLCIILVIIGCIALYGSWSLPMTARYTLGPRAAPLIYSVLLIVFSILIFFMQKDIERIRISSVLQEPGRKGLILFVLLLALTGMSYFLGFMVSIFIFTAVGLVLIEDWRIYKALIFSLAWVFTIHLIFVRFLGARLMVGALIKRFF